MQCILLYTLSLPFAEIKRPVNGARCPYGRLASKSIGHGGGGWSFDPGCVFFSMLLYISEDMQIKYSILLNYDSNYISIVSHYT